MSDLYKEADDWLGELGYSIFHKNGNGTWGNYIHNSYDSRKPNIEVREFNGEYQAKASYHLPQSMINLETPYFSFRNKNFKRQLDLMEEFIYKGLG